MFHVKQFISRILFSLINKRMNATQFIVYEIIKHNIIWEIVILLIINLYWTNCLNENRANKINEYVITTDFSNSVYHIINYYPKEFNIFRDNECGVNEQNNS